RPVLKQHEDYFGLDLVILRRGRHLISTPSASFRTRSEGGRLTTTYDLACNRPNIRRIFGGIGCRAFTSQSRDLTTRPPRPAGLFGI
ncbi:hypothetical protein AVEN_88726-1, partial [Araneus ventricosus]